MLHQFATVAFDAGMSIVVRAMPLGSSLQLRWYEYYLPICTDFPVFTPRRLTLGRTKDSFVVECDGRFDLTSNESKGHMSLGCIIDRVNWYEYVLLIIKQGDISGTENMVLTWVKRHATAGPKAFAASRRLRSMPRLGSPWRWVEELPTDCCYSSTSKKRG